MQPVENFSPLLEVIISKEPQKDTSTTIYCPGHQQVRVRVRQFPVSLPVSLPSGPSNAHREHISLLSSSSLKNHPQRVLGSPTLTLTLTLILILATFLVIAPFFIVVTLFLVVLFNFILVVIF